MPLSFVPWSACAAWSLELWLHEPSLQSSPHSSAFRDQGAQRQGVAVSRRSDRRQFTIGTWSTWRIASIRQIQISVIQTCINYAFVKFSVHGHHGSRGASARGARAEEIADFYRIKSKREKPFGPTFWRLNCTTNGNGKAQKERHQAMN